jgi:myo-inositol-1(or 4)-monophosphatase
MSTAAPAPLSEQAWRGSGLSSQELQSLCAVARTAAEAGAQELQKLFGQLERVREKGRAGDLVTEADVAAEQAVLAVLSEQTPDVDVLAEESGQQQRGSTGLQWCVDPLDGTTNYAHGYPFFGTSIGLTWQGLPLLGALAVPALNQLYWAAPGQGAWCNGSPLHVSSCDQLQQSLLVTGFAYDRHTRLDNNYAEFAYFTHRTHGVRRGGAAAVDLAFVASGVLDGYWERGLSPWDLAAGIVLVEQASGVVCAYDGSEAKLSEGRLIACAPGLRQSLIDGLAACRPLSGASFGVPELDSRS